MVNAHRSINRIRFFCQTWKSSASTRMQAASSIAARISLCATPTMHEMGRAKSRCRRLLAFFVLACIQTTAASPVPITPTAAAQPVPVAPRALRSKSGGELSPTDAISTTLSLVRLLQNGTVPVPPGTKEVLIEVGANSRNTADQEMLPRRPNAFLLTFEPLLDKYATLLSSRLVGPHPAGAHGSPR